MTSTALEVWRGRDCARDLLRKRIWSGPSTLSKFMLRPRCFAEHLALNASDGGDPDGIKVRAASGLHAADSFGYVVNVWGAIIENLARVGYDESSMALAAYDWRLSALALERRDQYFTRLRATVELLVEGNGGERAVLVGHSLGSVVLHHFSVGRAAVRRRDGGPAPCSTPRATAGDCAAAAAARGACKVDRARGGGGGAAGSSGAGRAAGRSPSGRS